MRETQKERDTKRNLNKLLQGGRVKFIFIIAIGVTHKLEERKGVPTGWCTLKWGVGFKGWGAALKRWVGSYINMCVCVCRFVPQFFEALRENVCVFFYVCV